MIAHHASSLRLIQSAIMAKQGRIRYEIEEISTHISEDDLSATLSVRRYGKIFYIDVDPCQFVNSPQMTDRYLSYLALLKSGEEELDNIHIEDAYEWILSPFHPLFVTLAPRIDNASVELTLQDWIRPEWFHFNLGLVNEKRLPHKIESERPPRGASGVFLDSEFQRSLETWTKLYSPANLKMKRETVVVDDLLFKPPKTLFIEDEQTECYFKRTYSPLRTRKELESYKEIQMAGLTAKFNICHCYGLVVDKNGSVLGLLLKNIEGAETLYQKVDPETLDDPPMHIRQRIWEQISKAVGALHKNGIIWSDVKADNVLVDNDYNAWIIDFGPGYTEGWVTREDSGTVKGDLDGLEKLRKYLLHGEDILLDTLASFPQKFNIILTRR